MSGDVQTAPLAGEDGSWLQTLSSLLKETKWSPSLHQIVERLRNNVPLSKDDGVLLFQHENLHEIGALANCVRTARFGDQAFFNSNVHINQTNICVLACRFCAFRRGPKAKDAYAMSIETYLDDLANYADFIDEVHSVGGLHPDWTVDHYVDLFKAVKEQYPHVSIKALTAVEIKHLGQRSSISTKEVLQQLKDAGLTSLPGG